MSSVNYKMNTELARKIGYISNSFKLHFSPIASTNATNLQINMHIGCFSMNISHKYIHMYIKNAFTVTVPCVK